MKKYFLGKPVMAQLRENELKEEARINYAIHGHSDPIQKLIDERERNGGLTNSELRMNKTFELFNVAIENILSLSNLKI